MGNKNESIVYILTNDAMPGMVKIGMTDKPILERMKDLYSSGVPVPFECFHASRVKGNGDIERRLHLAFDKFRINKNREFFEVPPENILAILEMVEIEDVTPKEDFVETEEDRTAMDRLEKKAERFNFRMVEIPDGATLAFKDDESIVCTVSGRTKVFFENEEMSINKATLLIQGRRGRHWKAVQGPAYWIYNDEEYGKETLLERRKRMESEE